MRILSTTALLSILATSGFADGLTYGKFSFEYNEFRNGPSDWSQTDLEGEIEYQIGQVLLSANAANTSYEGGGYYRQVGAAAGYMITPEVLVGAGVINYSNDFGYDENSYDVFGQYQNGQYAFAVNLMQWDASNETYTTYFGEATVVPGVTLGAVLATYSDSDEKQYHLSAEYEAGPIFARAFYNGNTVSDFGLTGARASYDFGPRYRASAGLFTFTGDFAPEGTFIKVGGGAEVTDGLWFDAYYGVVTGSGAPDDVSRIQAVLSYEFGAPARVDRRMINDLETDLDFFGGPA